MAEIVFLLCVLLMLSNAFRGGGGGGRKVDVTDFLLAGRRSGTWSVGASLAATCLGGSAVVGMVGRAYSIGWGAFWWLGAGGIGLLLLGLVYAPIFQRASDAVTISDWLGVRAGKVPQRLSAVLIAVMWLGVIAAQFVAAAAVTSKVCGLSYGVGVFIVAAVVGGYTAAAGQAAVLKTDRLQLFFIVLAVSIPGLLLLLREEAVENEIVVDGLSHGVDSIMSGWHWFAMFIVVGGMYVVGPDMFSRVRTARSVSAARWGAIVGGVVIAAVGLVLAYIGISARIVLPVDTMAKDVLPSLIDLSLPAGMAAVVQAGVFAALLSSADTCLLTAASVVDRNLGMPVSSGTWRVRSVIVLFAAGAALIATVSPRVIGNIMIAYAAFAGGLLAPLLALPFIKVERKRLQAPVAVAMVVGASVAILAFVLKLGESVDFSATLAIAGLAGMISCAAIMLGWVVYAASSRN